MREVNDKFRMYGLVPYNLSPIQQGIQYGHAVVEFCNIMFDHGEHITNGLPQAFNEWRDECKTFIILNGGTTNNNLEALGTLNQHAKTLEEMDIQIAKFNEPDLGDQLTAVVFLVSERVYNKKKFPEFDGAYNGMMKDPEPMEPEYTDWKVTTFGSVKEADRVIEMREFLKQFRLA